MARPTAPRFVEQLGRSLLFRKKSAHGLRAHRLFELTGWVDHNPAFSAVLIIPTLGDEYVARLINGIGPRAFVNCISQAVLPPIHLALPNQYHATTPFLVALAPLINGSV